MSDVQALDARYLTRELLHMVRAPHTTWTALQKDGPNHLQKDGPNHLALRFECAPTHRMALITSGLCAFQYHDFQNGLISRLRDCHSAAAPLSL